MYQLRPIPTKECLIEELVELWAGRWMAWQHASINQDCQGLHFLVRGRYSESQGCGLIPVIMQSNGGPAGLLEHLSNHNLRVKVTVDSLTPPL